MDTDLKKDRTNSEERGGKQSFTSEYASSERAEEVTGLSAHGRRKSSQKNSDRRQSAFGSSSSSSSRRQSTESGVGGSRFLPSALLSGLGSSFRSLAAAIYRRSPEDAQPKLFNPHDQVDSLDQSRSQQQFDVPAVPSAAESPKAAAAHGILRHIPCDNHLPGQPSPSNASPSAAKSAQQRLPWPARILLPGSQSDAEPYARSCAISPFTAPASLGKSWEKAGITRGCAESITNNSRCSELEVTSSSKTLNQHNYIPSSICQTGPIVEAWADVNPRQLDCSDEANTSSNVSYRKPQSICLPINEVVQSAMDVEQESSNIVEIPAIRTFADKEKHNLVDTISTGPATTLAISNLRTSMATSSEGRHPQLAAMSVDCEDSLQLPITEMATLPVEISVTVPSVANRKNAFLRPLPQRASAISLMNSSGSAGAKLENAKDNNEDAGAGVRNVCGISPFASGIRRSLLPPPRSKDVPASLIAAAGASCS